jgi:hypothetical protein
MGNCTNCLRNGPEAKSGKSNKKGSRKQRPTSDFESPLDG